MDLQALMGQLLSKESIQELSQAAGTSQKDVKNVISAALPALLNGAKEQAQNTETASGFAGALNQHAANSTDNLGAFFKNIDLSDGAKIVSHLLGAKEGTETKNVSKKAGVSSQKTGSILSAAAPLLMSLLGQQANNENGSAQANGVGSLLSGLLGKADISSLASGLLGSLKDDKDDQKDNGLSGLTALFKKFLK